MERRCIQKCTNPHGRVDAGARAKPVPCCAAMHRITQLDMPFLKNGAESPFAMTNVGVSVSMRYGLIS